MKHRVLGASLVEVILVIAALAAMGTVVYQVFGPADARAQVTKDQQTLDDLRRVVTNSHQAIGFASVTNASLTDQQIAPALVTAGGSALTVLTDSSVAGVGRAFKIVGSWPSSQCAMLVKNAHQGFYKITVDTVVVKADPDSRIDPALLATACNGSALTPITFTAFDPGWVPPLALAAVANPGAAPGPVVPGFGAPAALVLPGPGLPPSGVAIVAPVNPSPGAAVVPPSFTCTIPAPVDTVLVCPLGQTGSITQRQTYSCPDPAGAPVLGAPTSLSNTCNATTSGCAVTAGDWFTWKVGANFCSNQSSFSQSVANGASYGPLGDTALRGAATFQCNAGVFVPISTTCVAAAAASTASPASTCPARATYSNVQVCAHGACSALGTTPGTAISPLTATFTGATDFAAGAIKARITYNGVTEDRVWDCSADPAPGNRLTCRGLQNTAGTGLNNLYYVGDALFQPWLDVTTVACGVNKCTTATGWIEPFGNVYPSVGNPFTTDETLCVFSASPTCVTRNDPLFNTTLAMPNDTRAGGGISATYTAKLHVNGATQIVNLACSNTSGYTGSGNCFDEKNVIFQGRRIRVSMAPQHYTAISGVGPEVTGVAASEWLGCFP